MYEEHQKKWVFDNTISIQRNSRPSQKNSGFTPTSQSKTGGATSLTPTKPAGNPVPCDSTSGRWTTFPGPGKPMDIGRLSKEGRCFKCQEKGHLVKDCPKKGEHKDIRSLGPLLEAMPMTTNIEEVKE
ncbi:uncharacterized protein ARMOST_07544 [Armillaria ostoyae]|uniref:CCHC-type domain-containing protein n=1 Tax=Armillaria ostoyae TaxID=47428 RepID=A0A284R639_ARMOS|nr:uncharacterized protein ARMOST_07544 [Armillaria ostoyae]